MSSPMYSFVDAFRDNQTAKKLTKYIQQLADPARTYRIVHV